MFGLMRFRADARSGDSQRREWQLHYCGTCKTIGRQYGQRARVLLNHDAVFLAELLTALGARDCEEWGGAFASRNCLRLPAPDEVPVVLRYAAAATVLLSEYKVADHEADSGHVRWAWARRLFSRSFRNARAELAALGFPLRECERILSRQTELEAGSANLEKAAVPTSEATALVFRHGARVAKLEVHEEALAALGYRFGRIVYVLDALEDFERDGRSGAFNALRVSGAGRETGARLVREEAEQLGAALDALGAPAEFRLRLRANVESRLGARFPVIHSCRTRPPRTVGERWRYAIGKTREWNTRPVAFAAVVAMAFLFPLHARTARSSGECLSLGLNLMAIGGLLATVQAGGAPRKVGRLRSGYNYCCGGWCGDCTADCCCEGCCDTCCDSACEGCCSSCECG